LREEIRSKWRKANPKLKRKERSEEDPENKGAERKYGEVLSSPLFSFSATTKKNKGNTL
jgi:hypothetical protein